MAREIGKAGKTLYKRLLRIAAVFGGVGLAIWLLIKLTAPWMGALALPLALLAVVRMLQDKEVERLVVASARGYRGEAQVGRVLSGLPSTWKVYHDVDLGGENADHVVVGPAGVFNVEVKNYTGPVEVRPNGLWVRGQRRDDLVRQAWRQAHKLQELLGVEVQPILVFWGKKVNGQVGRLWVMGEEDLLPHLKALPPRLTFAEAKQIGEVLERRVR
ncbi:nuclease-related domain-containing protein [Thermus sp.]